MTAPKPTPQATRDRIFAAARAAFAAEGMEGLTMRKVAKTVGITPMAIYRHFADRDALVDALALDGLDRWRDRIAAIEVVDPLAWLEQMGEEFLAYSLEEPRRFEAAFLLPARSARKFPEDFAAGRSPPGQIWLARLEDARLQGALKPDTNPLDVGLAVWGMGQGLVTLWRAGRITGGLDDFRRLYRQSLRRCIGAFATREPRP